MIKVDTRLAELRAILRYEDNRDLPLTDVELARSVIEKCRQLRTRAEKAEQQRDHLKITIEHLLLSADCSWEEQRLGHDWPDAVKDARAAIKAR